MPPTAAREPDVPDLTSPEDRKAKLAEADAHAKAAGRAVMAFAREALAQLRGNEALPEPFTHWTYASVQRVPPGGTAEGLLSQISAEETELRNKIAEAQRLIDEAGLRLREFMPLKMWLAGNGQGGYGLVEPGANLQVPRRTRPEASRATCTFQAGIRRIPKAARRSYRSQTRWLRARST
jgi:hypothetical protein